MRIVLLCHTAIRSTKNPDGPDYDKIVPSLSRYSWEYTMKWADMILRGSLESSAQKENPKNKFERAKGVGGKCPPPLHLSVRRIRSEELPSPTASDPPRRRSLPGLRCLSQCLPASGGLRWEFSRPRAGHGTGSDRLRQTIRWEFSHPDTFSRVSRRTNRLPGSIYK